MKVFAKNIISFEPVGIDVDVCNKIYNLKNKNDNGMILKEMISNLFLQWNTLKIRKVKKNRI